MRAAYRVHSYEVVNSCFKVGTDARDLGAHISFARALRAPTLTSRMASVAPVLTNVQRMPLAPAAREHGISAK
eukprot:13860695-Alexandrium_andersonii.AAC.1